MRNKLNWAVSKLNKCPMFDISNWKTICCEPNYSSLDNQSEFLCSIYIPLENLMHHSEWFVYNYVLIDCKFKENNIYSCAYRFKWNFVYKFMLLNSITVSNLWVAVLKILWKTYRFWINFIWIKWNMRNKTFTFL